MCPTGENILRAVGVSYRSGTICIGKYPSGAVICDIWLRTSVLLILCSPPHTVFLASISNFDGPKFPVIYAESNNTPSCFSSSLITNLMAKTVSVLSILKKAERSILALRMRCAIPRTPCVPMSRHRKDESNRFIIFILPIYAPYHACRLLLCLCVIYCCWCLMLLMYQWQILDRFLVT